MRPIVLSTFPSFTDRFEGNVSWMYLDIKRLITIGRGDLLESIDEALALPFVRKADGLPASKGSITDEWNTVKSLTAWAPRGGWAFADVTQLRLLPEAIDKLSFGRLASIESYLARRFPNFEQAPAAAQLGAVSMSWAMGPGFVFPHFASAFLRSDWSTCAAECRIDDKGNPGVKPRNVANEALFRYAADAGDPDSLPSEVLHP